MPKCIVNEVLGLDKVIGVDTREEEVEAIKQTGVAAEGHRPSAYGGSLGEFITARQCADPRCPVVVELFDGLGEDDSPEVKVVMSQWLRCPEGAGPEGLRDRAEAALGIVLQHGFVPKG